MGWEKFEKLFNDASTKSSSSKKPAKKIENLKLSRRVINDMVDTLLQDDSEPLCYTNSDEKSIKVKIIALKNGHYFAKISCEPFSDVENKQLFIKEAVEFALKEKKLAIRYQDMGVGGVIGDQNRLGFFYQMAGKIPPSNHAYAAFKLPGEDELCIEDPKTELFKMGDKLQSFFDDQVCAFAAIALFNFAYKALADYQDAPLSTSKMFEEIHRCRELKKIIKELEDKVGVSTETKDEIINSFIQTILKFDNPVEPEISFSSLFKI